MGQPFDDAIARRVLTIVMGPATQPPDETVEIATKAEISETEVLRTLQAPAEIDPPVVHREHDASLDIECWFAIEPGVTTWVDDAQEDDDIR